MPAHTVFIGLGSNLDDPVTQLSQALQTLACLPHSSLIQCSSFYASRPMGPQNQPDFTNAVAQLSTDLAPHDLLAELQKIEQSQGRQRKPERWGARTLDLDILLYADQVIKTDTLTVPHYGMMEREFVLIPLHEISPDLILPCGNSVKTVLNQVSDNGLKKLEMDIRWDQSRVID